MMFLKTISDSDNFKDAIKENIEKASDEIKEFTNQNAFLRETSIDDEDIAKSIFGRDTKAVTSYIDFVYGMEVDGQRKRYRSRLAAISYSIGFPALFKSDVETENPSNIAEEIKVLHREEDLVSILITLLNSKHVRRLLKKAKTTA